MECDNCGHDVDDADTATVHRIYVVPETWDQAGSSTTMTDVERWCWSCRTQYPHEEASAAGSGDTELSQEAEAPQ